MTFASFKLHQHAMNSPSDWRAPNAAPNSAPMLHCRGRFVAIAGLLLALAGTAAVAQRPINPDHVTFYTEPNFKGDSLVVEAGASVPNLATMQRPNQRPWVYAISSVKVDGGARTSVYTGGNFGGERLDITASVPDLYAIGRAQLPGATWDRCIASVSVTASPSVVVSAPPPTVYEQVPAAPPPSAYPPLAPPPTTVYVVPQPPPPPQVVIQEERPRIDPRAAETMVQHAYREVLDRPADPPGLRLYRERILREGWSERQVVVALQRSAEARAINPDVAITRMYREVLGRDPDPAGFAHYRALWRDGWTQGAMKDDLRRSNEHHDARIQDAITRAYREVLGRDPDPEGYAVYERLMREKGYSERDVRAALMSGDEYRRLHPRGR
jgi:hypothetical protein